MNTIFPLPPIDQQFIDQNPLFLLFESTFADADNHKSYIFSDPAEVLTTDDPGEIPHIFDRVQELCSDHYIAGYIAYEAGYSFQDIKSNEATFPFPLLHFAAFKDPIIFHHLTGKFNKNFEHVKEDQGTPIDYDVKDINANVSRDEYIESVNGILGHIKKGNAYQINYTFRNSFRTSLHPYSLYLSLKNSQKVSYSAFLKLENTAVLSLSPELFFRRDGNRMICKPMKGTIRRGRTNEEDCLKVDALRNSGKDIAENTMIVDLVRNDLGKISDFGTVRSASLYDIEKYRTLYQMTSTVQSTLRSGITYFDIFRSLFPCGSVTGAPKIRSMEIIRNTEKDYRQVYCGAIGFIAPGDKAIFNVPIRTLSLENNLGSIGIGSGIVADSLPETEYEECTLKGTFLTQSCPPFKLLETVLWDSEYFLLEKHLRRLSESAVYFDFVFRLDSLRKTLRNREKDFHHERKYKIRILLEEAGKFTVEHSELPSHTSAKSTVAVSRAKTNPNDAFLYHKTTNRNIYDSEYKRYASQGCFDVIFFNTRDELTEGAISNIILKKGGHYFTPPLASGVLAGTYRQHFMEKNTVFEKTLYKEDLHSADTIYLCNSVRGQVEVTLI